MCQCARDQRLKCSVPRDMGYKSEFAHEPGERHRIHATIACMEYILAARHDENSSVDVVHPAEKKAPRKAIPATNGEKCVYTLSPSSDM